jgi:hypothetical protein
MMRLELADLNLLVEKGLINCEDLDDVLDLLRFNQGLSKVEIATQDKVFSSGMTTHADYNKCFKLFDECLKDPYNRLQPRTLFTSKSDKIFPFELTPAELKERWEKLKGYEHFINPQEISIASDEAIKLYQDLDRLELIDKVKLLPEFGIKVPILLLKTKTKNRNVWETIANRLLKNVIEDFVNQNPSNLAVLLKVVEFLKTIEMSHPLIEFMDRVKQIDKRVYWSDFKPQFYRTVELMTQAVLVNLEVDDYLIDMVNHCVVSKSDKENLMNRLNSVRVDRDFFEHWNKWFNQKTSDLPNQLF